MALRHLSEQVLTEYADGGLPHAEMEAAEQHLRECPACAAALARAQSASQALRALRTVPAPDGLRRRVIGELAARYASTLSCRKAVSLLQGHLDGALPPITEISLGRHLTACGRCRSALAALSSLVGAVRDLPEAESPPRVREAVQAAKQSRSGMPSPTPWAARWRPAFAVAALVAVGGLTLIARSVSYHPGPARLVAGGRQPEVAVGQPSEVGASMEVAASPSLRGDAQPTAEGAMPAEISNALSSPTPPAVRLVRVPASAISDRPKGPAPEARAVGHSLPKTPLPSALQTLRVVARSASHGGELQRAMELAGERFSTLRSEAMLARLPQTAVPETGGEGTAAGDAASPSGETGVSLPGGEHRSDGLGGPAWHGASSSSTPFV